MTRAYVTIVAMVKQKVLHICVCVRVCVRSLAYVGARARGRVRVCARVLPTYPACTRMRHVVVCGLSASTKYFHIS
jgi:hypothetical protein